MSSKRPAILMAVLLVLIAGYLAKPYWEGRYQDPPAEPELPGENSISGLRLSQDAEGIWFADADYFFNGKGRGAHCRLQLLESGDPAMATAGDIRSDQRSPEETCGNLVLGRHHLHLELHTPGEGTTRAARMRMLAGTRTTPLAQAYVAQQVDWPDWDTYNDRRRNAGKSGDQLIADAAREVDQGSERSLSHAKQLLEKVITRDPAADSAYLELARIAMKSNWGPEGLSQAESLIQTALRLKPDSANAKILMAYVQTHQGRYKEAQANFAEAAKSDPPNLWLWVNWGEMHALQGQTTQAIEKYRTALTRPNSHGANDRPRHDAYRQVMPLLDSRRDYKVMEDIYKQEVAEFGAATCGISDYARFELTRMGNVDAAISIARSGIEANCPRSGEARDVLGMALYTQWNAAPDSTAGQAALNQARVYLPAGMRAFYLLASDDRTLPAAARLAHLHEPVDAYDNDAMTALAHALADHELPTARRLLGLGARPDVPVGAAKMPAALIPVATDDVEGVRLMQKSGVDYRTLRFQGATALDMARHQGRPDLVKLLDPQANAV